MNLIFVYFLQNLKYLETKDKKALAKPPIVNTLDTIFFFLFPKFVTFN